MTATASIPVVHPGDALSRRQRLVYVLVLGALVALGPFTIDLYIPAFPALVNDFGVSDESIQLTLTATTIGFALGQLVVGPWSDRVGRRLPLIVATAVHVLASLGAAIAPDVTVLIIFRVLQGMGAAGGGVVAMAVVRDLFGGRPLVRMLSRLALVIGVAPVIAPLIGSQLLAIIDWRGVFVFLAGYGVAVIALVAFLVIETLPPERRNISGHSSARQRYKAVLTDRVFVGVALLGGMSFAGLFVYLSTSPFLFQEVYGLDVQQYGLLFASISIAVVIGTQSSARLTRVIGPQWILVGTSAVQFVSALAIIVLDQAGAGLWGIFVPVWLFILACGFSFPCIQVLALVNHGREAGTAAAVLGAANFGIAGIVSPIVGLLGTGSASPMGAVMAVTAAVSIAAIWLIVRPRTVPALAD